MPPFCIEHQCHFMRLRTIILGVILLASIENGGIVSRDGFRMVQVTSKIIISNIHVGVLCLLSAKLTY